jgi:CMP-N,N'-diacetyllegionaminic acid synthase
MSMRVLGLIPARGGSERVPAKNLRPLGGRPLIAWTIDAAMRASTIERVIVSTDSDEIATIARACGAETPFLRPAALAQRDSTEMEFLLHALDWLRLHEAYEPDVIALLYPTSPFRKAETIERAVRTFAQHPEADALRSVRLCSEHPYKMWTIAGDRLRPLMAGDGNTPTLSYHRLPIVYVQNASIYLTRPRTLREKGSPIGDVIVPFVMDEDESVDINTPLDLALAELLIDRRRMAARAEST